MSDFLGYRPHLAERTGLVEESQRRRKTFERFISREVDSVLTGDAVRRHIDKTINEKLKAEIDAIVARHMEEKRIELNAMADIPRIPLRDLMIILCEVTGRTSNDLISAARSRPIAWPRFFGYWLFKRLRPDLSLPSIGRCFGNRDHTTIMHGLRKLDAMKDENPFLGWLTHPKTIDLLSVDAEA